jgi:hypothetical protein
MRLSVLLFLFCLSPLLFGQDATQQASQMATQQAQQASQMATQQAQQDAAEAQRLNDTAMAAHQQAMRNHQAALNTGRMSSTNKPVFSPAPGTYIGKMPPVTITDSTKGAVIHFTTDGSTPTLKSQTYTGPIALSATTTLKAIAIAHSRQRVRRQRGNTSFDDVLKGPSVQCRGWL